VGDGDLARMDIGVNGERHKVVEAVHSAAQEIEAQEMGRGRRKRKKKRRREGGGVEGKRKEVRVFLFLFLSVFTVRHLGCC
jgi:hypothetical protein